MLEIVVRFGDRLKCDAGSHSFSPDHTALFLCACPKQLEPVWQDGQSTNLQARTPRGVVNYGTVDNRISRTADYLGDLGHM
jgi:hypothetical protein